MSRALGYIAFSAGLTIAVTLSTMAFGHGKATGIVKERMESMVVLRDAARALGGLMKDMDGHAMNHGATLDLAMLVPCPPTASS